MDPVNSLEAWTRLFPTAAPAAREHVLSDIVLRYQEPHRRYHTLDHVDACMEEFRLVSGLCDEPHAVELAIWLHDAFYETRAVNNEKRSAVLCRNLARHLGRPELGAQAAEMILCTAHLARAPVAWDERVLCDIDLSILGAAPEVFDRYESEIRQEYDWVPEERFRDGRRGILQGFLGRSKIYSTRPFAERLEEQARGNIQRSLKALGP